MNSYLAKINDYYNQSLVDYNLIWQTHKTYSMHYGYYDKLNNCHQKAILNMIRVVANTAKITSGDTVLDAGCGIGGTSIWIAKNIGAKVTGININKNHLEIARKLAAKEKLSKSVRFIEGDYHNTRFKNNYFNAVIGIESFCYSDDKSKFVGEMHRILKKDGSLVIADGFVQDNFSMTNENSVRRFLDGWAIKKIISLSNYSLLLKKHRFKQIKCLDITDKVMKSSFRLYLASVINYPIAYLLYLIGLRSKVQMGNISAAYNQYKSLKSGFWKYCIYYAEK